MDRLTSQRLSIPLSGTVARRRIDLKMFKHCFVFLICIAPKMGRFTYMLCIKGPPYIVRCQHVMIRVCGNMLCCEKMHVRACVGLNS